eukprot:scaffold4991_cov156-Ochromonas_danica.AAC.8
MQLHDRPSDMEESNEKTPLNVAKDASYHPFVKISPRILTFKRFSFLVGVVLLITLLDILVFFLGSKTPGVDHAEVSFNSEHADVQLVASGPVSKSSYLASFDTSGGYCEYSYHRWNESEIRFGGRVDFSLPSDRNAANAYYLVVQAKDTNYATLRRLVQDIRKHQTHDSVVKLNCAIGLSATLYGTVPLSYTYVLKTDLDLADYVSSVEDSAKNKYFEGNVFGKNIADLLKVDKLRTDHVDISFFISLTRHVKPSYPFRSFLLHVPEISYSFALVDRSDEKKSYFTVSSQSLTVDLMQSPQKVSLEVSLSCSPVAVYEGQDVLTSTSRGQCNLLSPLDVLGFRREIAKNAFVNMTTKSNSPSFFSKYLGESHYIRSVEDDGSIPWQRKIVKQFGRVDNAVVPIASSAQSHKPLLQLMSEINNQNPCLILDTDGSALSQTCFYSKANVFSFYVETYDDEGYRGHIESTTQWGSGSMPMNEFHLTNSSGFWVESGFFGDDRSGDVAFGGLVFSEAAGSLVASVGWNNTQGSKFYEKLETGWHVKPVDETSYYYLQSQTMLEGVDPILVLGNLSYGSDQYDLRTLVHTGPSELNVSSSDVEGDDLFVGVRGAYGGDALDWHFTVNPAVLVVNQEKQGEIELLLAFDGHTNGFLLSRVNVSNGEDEIVLQSAIGSMWQTESSWSEQGETLFYYLFDMNETNWNVTGGLSYADHHYRAFVAENDLGLKNDELWAEAQGGYGGDWYEWWADVSESELILLNTTIGFAQGRLNYAVPAGGGLGTISSTGSLEDSAYNQLYNGNNTLQWGSSSSWQEAGEVKVESCGSVDGGEGLTWNATSSLSYGDHYYILQVVERDLFTDEADADNLDMWGEGKYGGDWDHWWVTLTDAELIVTNSSVGTAAGALTFDMASSGVSGLVTYEAAANSSSTPEMSISGDFEWSSSSTWTSAGSISADNVLYLRDVISWNSSGVFYYGGNRYGVYVREAPLGEVDPTFVAEAYGGYGGDQYDWWGSVDKSLLMAQSEVVGYATGRVYYVIPASVLSGSIGYRLNVNDASSMVLASTSLLNWGSVEDNWQAAGEGDVTVSLFVLDTANFNLTGHFDYGDNGYFVQVLELPFTSSSTNATSEWNENLLAEAWGGYGGDLNNWWLEVSKSVLVVNELLVGTAVGQLTYQVPVDGETGQIAITVIVNDDVESIAFSNEGSLSWVSPSSDWEESGSIVISDVMSIPLYSLYTNLTASAKYSLPNYVLEVDLLNWNEQESSGGGVDGVYMDLSAVGRYGGDLYDWWATVDNSSLVVDSALLGTAVGQVSCAVLADGSAANMAYVANAFDSDKNSVLESTSSLSWSPSTPSNSNWQDGGAISLSSLLWLPQSPVLSWNATGKFQFGDNQFSLYVSEQDYEGVNVTEEDEHLSMVILGTYDVVGPSEWMFYVAEAVLYVEQDLYLNAQAILEVDVHDAGKAGLLLFNGVNYDNITTAEHDYSLEGKEALSAMRRLGKDKTRVSSEELAFGVNGSTIWTSNVVLWDGTSSIDSEGSGSGNVFGTLYSDTYWDASSLFNLVTSFNLSLPQQTAEFVVEETLQGVRGLLFYSKAAYDVSIGMLTAITTDIYYEDNLLLAISAGWNYGVQGVNATTAAPSTAPSLSPTVVPTLTPTALPTVVPSMVPSLSPTVVATLSPTLKPSYAPTSYVQEQLQFSSNITLQGVQLVGGTLDSASQQALIYTTAETMNISANYVHYLGCNSAPTNVSAAFLRHRAGSLSLTDNGGSSVVASMQVQVPLDSSASATTVYASLTGSLNTAVTSGAYTTSLQLQAQSLGSTQLTSASATSVSNSGMTVIVPDNDNDDDGGSSGLSTGALVGIIIGSVVGAVLIACGVYFIYSKRCCRTSRTTNRVAVEF